eukprot:g11774.t1
MTSASTMSSNFILHDSDWEKAQFPLSSRSSTTTSNDIVQVLDIGSAHGYSTQILHQQAEKWLEKRRQSGTTTTTKDGVAKVSVLGLELAPNFVKAATEKFPHIRFERVDVLEEHEFLRKLMIAGIDDAAREDEVDAGRSPSQRQSQNKQRFFFVDISGTRELRALASLLGFLLDPTTTNADAPDPDARRITTTSTTIVVKSAKLHQLFLDHCKKDIASETAIPSARFSFDTLIAAAAAEEVQGRSKFRRNGAALEDRYPLKRPVVEIDDVVAEGEEPPGTTGGRVEVCRFHNYDKENGCKRFAQGRCPLDHEHCHFCLQKGHRAVDCELFKSSGGGQMQKQLGLGHDLRLSTPRHALGCVALPPSPCSEKSSLSVDVVAVAGWQYGSAPAPSNGQDHYQIGRRLAGVCAVGRHVYVFGGFLTEREKTDSVLRIRLKNHGADSGRGSHGTDNVSGSRSERREFEKNVDDSTYEIDSLPSLPFRGKKVCVAAAAANGSIYLFPYGGGATAANGPKLHVWRFDPEGAGGSYTELVGVTLPLPDWHCFAIASRSEAEKGDLATASEITPAPRGQIIYLCGGASEGKWTRRCFAFHVADLSWTELPSMRQARRRAAAAVA